MPSPKEILDANHILIVDDNTAIHEDFKRILMSKDETDSFDADAAAFFGTTNEPPAHRTNFDLEFATQGQEALEKVKQAIKDGHPYAVVFMDVRMPPGWDGIETAKHLWEVDPDLQIVICTAFSDYSWDDMVGKLGKTDKLLILRKPFDVIEAEQAAHAFSKKWLLLQQSRRHAVFLEQTMDLSPLMIFWISENGSIAYTNQAACRKLQQDATTIHSLKASDIFTSWNEQAWKAIWSNVRQRKNIKQETFIASQSGDPIPVEAIITTLDFQERQVMCITAQDITERLNTLRELANARDAALESARMKSQFLANMSHEIRTPMNGVIGMAELLNKTDLNSMQREYVGIINQSGAALLSIINDILDSAKIESGKIEFQQIHFDLTELVRGTMHTVRPNAAKKDLKLSSHIDPAVIPMLCGDPGRLRQVLLNLVSNAVKFTSAGEVSLTVELVDENPEEYELRFTVKDTGIGIEAEHLNRVFQPFTQADSTNKRSYGGTGLGLTISSQIVQALGGIIEVKSQEGRGAEFWFAISLKKASAVAATARPRKKDKFQALNITSARSPNQRVNEGASLKILLAEDNAVNRKVTLMQLQQIGCNADVVENGELALKAMDLKEYDVILMDCQMPIMDGYEATRQIRLRYSRPIRIIALTANAMKEDRSHCLKAGMDDYLSKPLNSESLAAAIGINLKSPQEPLGSPPTPATVPQNQIEKEATDAVDIERLLEVTGNDSELFIEISQQYLEQAAEILKDMEQSIHSGQHDETCKLAHKLAGSSATCGMNAIVSPLRTIESLNSNQTSDAIALHQDALHQLQRIRQFLNQS